MPFWTDAQILPVLAVHQVPEVDRVGGAEAGFRDLVGMEQEVAVDPRVTGVERPERERHDVVRREAHHEVRVDQLALVLHAFVLGEPGERCTGRRPGERERRRSLAVRDAAVPVELAPAALLERRHELAELGVDGPQW